MLSVSVPHVCYQRPVWDLDGSFTVSSVFKSLLCWWKADPHMCSFGINPGDPSSKLYRVTFLSSTLSAVFLWFLSGFWFPEALFFRLPVRKLGLWLPHFALHFCSSAWVMPEDTHRQSNEAGPILLGPQLHQLERKVLLPQNFGSSNLPLSPSQDWLEAGMHWNEENGLCPLLGAPFPAPGARTRGLLLLLFLSAGDHFHFQVERHWIQDEGPKRGKNGRLATGLVVLWILVFKPSLPTI